MDGTETISSQVTVARVRLGGRAAKTLNMVAAALRSSGVELRHLEVPVSGLPRHASSEDKRLLGAFAATPEVLEESWRVSRHIEASTSPGEVVLVSELAPAAGVFALQQAMKQVSERRRVLIAAGDGELLQHLAVAGAIDGVNGDAASSIDWEMTAYRFADAVLVTSARAAELLGHQGVESFPVASSSTAVESPSPIVPNAVWLPEPVSRLSQTPTILRGLSAVVERYRDLRVYVTQEDRLDHLWIGTTWQAMARVRALLGNLLVRTSAPPRPDVVVLGDPFAVPGDELEALRADGTRLVVAADSVAAALWPEAATWADQDGLAAALTSVRPPRPAPVNVPPVMRSPSSDPSRAQRVSVGIPIFEEAGFLDECVESVLRQSQPPHEVVLVDDGSTDPDVQAAVSRWSAHPAVAAVRQTNHGVCVARNTALDRMTGDAFVFVDSDDLLHTDFIAECAEALRANPDLWAVATWTEFFGDYEAVEAKPPFDRRVGMRENPIVSTSALVAMEVRDAGIRFAPDLAFLYCEDWDVWSQIVAAGGSFGLIPRPLALHRVHPTSGGHQRTPLGHALGKARATRHLLTRSSQARSDGWPTPD